MGVLIIALAVFAIGIIILVCENKGLIAEVWALVGIMTATIGLILTLVLGAYAVVVAVKVGIGTEYQNAVFERETIVYRLDKESENIVGNELLYNDIVEFNNKLRSAKNGAGNFWINWYYNKDIATIEYIELPNKEM